MKRPLLYYILVFILGILIEQKWNSYTVMDTLCCVIFAVIIKLLIGKRIRIKAPLICGIMLLCGQLLIMLHSSAAYDIVNKYDMRSATITGRVESIVTYESNKMECIVRLNSIKSGNLDEKANFKVRFVYYGEDAPSLCYGDVIETIVKLRKPNEAQNTGSFDYNLYLKSRRIYLNATTSLTCKVVGHDNASYSVVYLAAKLREKMLSRSNDGLKGEVKALYNAIIIGDKSLMSNELKDALSKAGISHIASVSGMHLSIIITIFMFALTYLFGRKRIVRVIIILAALFFMLLMGESPSIMRAVIMCVVYQMSVLFLQENDTYTALAVSAFVILLVNPFYLFDLGFLLSVVSTLGILLFANKLESHLSFLPNKISTLIAISLSAQIITLPITINTFNYIPVYSLLANIIAVPLLIPVLILGFLYAILGKAAFLGYVLAALCNFILAFIIAASKVIATLPFSTIKMCDISVFYMIAFYSIIMFLFYIHDEKGHYKRVAAIIVCISMMLSSFIVNIQYINKVKLDFLNVGHGDCALVTTPQGNSILIDGGGEMDYDIGENIVGEYLYSKGIRKVDYAFVSHYHMDHADGILSLVKNKRIKNLILPNYASDEGYRDKLIEAANNTNTKIIFIDNTDKLNLDNIIFTVISPPYTGEEKDNNELSMVLKMDYYNTSVVFTGDITQETERKMLSLSSDVRCDILKVAHHGSKNSSCEEFLRIAKPRYAVISIDNSAALPNEDAVNRIRRNGADIFSTNVNGTISFVIDKNKICQIETLRGWANDIQ